MTNSVSSWIPAVEKGNDEAIAKLWNRFFPQLVREATAAMRDHPRRAYDEEDVALSVLNSFVDAAGQNRFPQLHDRHNLWRILLQMTRHKVIDCLRHETAQRRGAGMIRGESVFATSDTSGAEGLAEFDSDEPSPEVAAELLDDLRHRLRSLTPALREIAALKMQGLTNREIAARIGLSCRSVERKLERIRLEWTTGEEE